MTTTTTTTDTLETLAREAARTLAADLVAAHASEADATVRQRIALAHGQGDAALAAEVERLEVTEARAAQAFGRALVRSAVRGAVGRDVRASIKGALQRAREASEG